MSCIEREIPRRKEGIKGKGRQVERGGKKGGRERQKQTENGWKRGQREGKRKR